MSKKIFEVALLLTASDKASKIINDAAVKSKKSMENMSKFGDKAMGVGMGAGAAGLAVMAPLGMAINAAEESEVATKRLNQVFKTMGETNNKAATAAANYASELQMQIGVEDEAIMMTQAKLATFGKVSDATARMSGVFDRATRSAYDMAAGGFGEAEQNAVMLGKALQNPAAGAMALSKAGALNKSDIPLIKQIQATKGLGAAQEYVLKAVEKQFKGQAANLATESQKMKIKLGEVAETTGRVLLPKFNALMNKVGAVADKFSKWTAENPKLFSGIIKGAAAVGALLLAISGTAFVVGILSKGIAGTMAIMGAYRNLMVLMKAAQMAYTFTLLSTGSGFAAVTAGLQAMNLGFLASPIFWGIAILAGAVFMIIKYWEPIKAFFGKLWDGIKIAFNKFWTFIKNWGVLLLGPVGLIIKYWDNIRDFFLKLWPKVKSIFVKALDFYLGLPKKFLSIGSDIVMGLWNGMKAKAAALFDFVKGIGKSVANAFKSVLGIASPSKVFMDYGVNITEGASKGMQKGQNALKTTAGGLGKSIAPNAGKSSGGGGGITVNFAPVISGGGSGSDIAAEIKKMVPQLIKEIESAMQRKQRLSY